MEDKLVQLEDGTTQKVEIQDTVEVPEIINPDEREYENIEIEVEGGK